MSGKIRVLVIDDEAAILRFLKPALEANNYELTRVVGSSDYRPVRSRSRS
jgi:DNA-binding response OmpR family regulator